MSLRAVKQILETKPTIEGAGVKLQRAFGFGKTQEFDPFLLLDDFRNENPADYLAGFPWHPHRGIETITYVLAGEVEHGDSLGNKGKMGAGDVQWMTAGSGILHQEMPRGDAERPHAWLPAVGQPARGAQDDRPALPGHSVERHPRGHGGRRDEGAHYLRRVLGQDGAGGRRGGRPALRRHFGAAVQAQAASRLRPRATHSLTSLPARERFAMLLIRRQC